MPSSRRGLLLFLAISPALLHSQDPRSVSWQATGALNVARFGACAVTLPDGRVLVTGGRNDQETLNSTEIYNPESGVFRNAAPLDKPRAGHRCLLLTDGRVLVVGGDSEGRLLTLARYTPDLDHWETLGEFGPARSGITATLLDDGRVLLAGGRSTDGFLAAMEIYDPDSGTVVPLPVSLTTARAGHTATLLTDGRVLFAGGETASGAAPSAQVYDPVEGLLYDEIALATPRMQHSATVLPDGRVLIAAGTDGADDLNTAEVFLPHSNSIEAVPSRLNVARRDHFSLLIKGNGSVLIAGGSNGTDPLTSTEVFDFDSGEFLPSGSLTAPRTGIIGAMLANGRVLAIGGRNQGGASAACGIRAVHYLDFDKNTYLNNDTTRARGGHLNFPNRTVTFRLERVLNGVTTDASARLLTTSVTTNSEGDYDFRSFTNVTLDDIPATWILRASISGTPVISASYTPKVRTRLVATPPAQPTIQGQPVRVSYFLQSDDARPNMGGTISLGIAGLSASQTPGSDGRGSLSMCCPATPDTYTGVLSYSGTSRYHNSRDIFLHTVLTNVVRITAASAAPGLRLLSAAPVVVTISSPTSVGPAPLGAISITKSGNPVANMPIRSVSTSSSTGTFNYTANLDDRRSGSACFAVQYTGDSNYAAATFSFCLPVGPAPTTLVANASALTYNFSEMTPINVSLFFNPNLGIVSRTVTILNRPPNTTGSTLATVTLTPNPSGSSADGTVSIRLPFNVQPGQIVAEYAASGDLAGSSTPLNVTMNPVPTQLTMTSPPGATATNPFTVAANLCTATSQQVPFASLRGSVQFFDGNFLLGTVAVPTNRQLPTCAPADGTSNTVIIEEGVGNITLNNVSRPVGSRSITAVYSGDTLARPATSAPKIVTVQ